MRDRRKHRRDRIRCDPAMSSSIRAPGPRVPRPIRVKGRHADRFHPPANTPPLFPAAPPGAGQTGPDGIDHHPAERSSRPGGTLPPSSGPAPARPRKSSHHRLVRKVSVATNERNNEAHANYRSSNQRRPAGSSGSVRHRRDVLGYGRWVPITGGLARHVPGRPARVHLGHAWPARSRPPHHWSLAQTFWAFSFFVIFESFVQIFTGILRNRGILNVRWATIIGGIVCGIVGIRAAGRRRPRSGRPTSGTRSSAASAPGWSTRAASTSWPSGTRRRRAGGPGS